MDLNKVTIRDPRTRDSAGHIDVTFIYEDGSEHPFTATSHDSAEHGRLVYEKALNGDYGEISFAPTDGHYVWVDGAYKLLSDTLSKEQKIATAETAKAKLLTAANSTISIWQSELLLGTIEDKDKTLLQQWITYIKALKAVDVSSAPDIAWPTAPSA